MGDYTLLADALRYPTPGQAQRLAAEAAKIQDEATRKEFEKFTGQIQKLSLGEWEELHTHTLDLSPDIAPYVGFQMWGDSYQRGNFMAALNRQMQTLAIDLDGELPDHLGPVLRYLDAAAPPEEALVECLGPALEKMAARLQKAAPGNPYNSLIAAIQTRCRALNSQPAAKKPEANL